MEGLALTREPTIIGVKPKCLREHWLRQAPAQVSFTAYRKDTPLWTPWTHYDPCFTANATEAGQLQESIQRHLAYAKPLS